MDVWDMRGVKEKSQGFWLKAIVKNRVAINWDNGEPNAVSLILVWPS